MEINLKKADINDCEKTHQMQVESFKELLDKYNDYDTSPASESIDRIEQRMAQDYTEYYLVCMDSVHIGFIRVVRLDDTTNRISPHVHFARPSR
ncbi:MAG: hypothetical protein FWD05_14610 [Oscillospiraceae bacterium]|nr:hypothetical protein [Oscillospiraceae bacterium]